MPASLIVTAGVTVPAEPDRVWDLIVDWSRQHEWIWATRTTGGHGAGASVIGRTGIGPAAFTDTMQITEWDPPRRCTVTHDGPIVRGEGIFEVRPLGPGRSEFRWTERIVLPAPVAELIPARAEAVVTRLAYAVLGPLARIGLGSSLVRFARLTARAAEEPRERMLRSTAVAPTTKVPDAGLPDSGLPDSGLPDAGAWALDPAFAHLNHGGFGATPVCVLAAQQAWRAELEGNPTDFLVRRLPELLADVRAKVAGFLAADQEGVVFTGNATAGIQTVIAQVALSPGDEVLTTDHCYPAIRVQLQHAAGTSGAQLRTARVPLTAHGPAEVTQAVVSQLTRRSRLLVVDQVASCSGMVFPVAEIAAECRRAGVPVLVDGAHATGMLNVNLSQLGADFWVGNLHKWVCAPKASAVLYTAPAWRDTLRPLVGSHGFHDGYRQAFDWTGTSDPTALLSVPAALDFFAQAGWEAVRRHNNQLASDGAELVASRLGTRPPLSAGPELAASMRLVPLAGPLTEDQARALERTLLTVHHVVVPVTCYDGWRWLRVSGQLYNTLADYERLAGALI